LILSLKHFSFRYMLPEGTKPEDVSSNLSADGVLVVTAKKVPPVNVEIQQEQQPQLQQQQK
jgi:Hsp20/alpha crystallin family